MSMSARQAFVGLGANLGDREETLRRAVTRLRETAGVTVLAVSPSYDTDPVGVVDQPEFLNAVVGLATTLAPEQLLERLQEIEREFGRERTVRWGPRTLDLDLLAYAGETRETPTLTLPHPRMLERDFVRVPLLDVLRSPSFSGATWEALRAALSTTAAMTAGVRRHGLLTAGAPHTPLDGATVERLTRLKRGGVTLGLERMRLLMAALGHPERRVPVVHIAGTNGKGSVAAMVEAMLRAAGWRTGLYTSPHLVRLGERIQVNRLPLSSRELSAHVATVATQVDALVARHGAEAAPTYFEFMTALAFRHFAEAGCDIAVIEVGMGGRLDATNVVMPEVSAITSIGLDHSEFLGTTLAAIAGEKAGIIKPARPVVLGRLPVEAERVIRNVAGVQGAPVVAVAEVFGEDLARYPGTNLGGMYQRVNAATATLVARHLPAQWRLTDAVIAEALRSVDWPARWQRIDVSDRTLVIDASHNVEGAEALDRNLAVLARESHRAPIVVVGVLGAGRARPLLEAIARHARELWLVAPRQSRACSVEELRALVPSQFTGTITSTTVDAVIPAAGTCALGNPGDAVVITGSIYLAGEVLARLEPWRGPAEPELQDF